LHFADNGKERADSDVFAVGFVLLILICGGRRYVRDPVDPLKFISELDGYSSIVLSVLIDYLIFYSCCRIIIEQMFYKEV